MSGGENGAGANRRPRVLLFSERNVEQPKWQSSQYEFEDVVMAADDVRLLAPPAAMPAGPRLVARQALNFARRTLGMAKEWYTIDPLEVEGEYDLFFAIFHWPVHLSYLDRLARWRERCRKAVCLLVELWPRETERGIYGPYFPLLEQFDQIFVSIGATVPALQRVVGRPCAFLPMGVDALRFAPCSPPPPRTIDFYSFGRRLPDVHRALLDLAERERRFYVYDTFRNSELLDYREHRALLASCVQHSRYVLAHRITDSPDRLERTGGAEGVGPRWFEAAAGGAVLIGSAPNTPDYDALFDWPDATIELPADARLLPDAIAALDAEPERLAAAGRNNVVNCLRRHDWLHRWERVLDSVGLPHTAAMAARAARLDALAREAGVSSPPTRPLAV